MPSMLTIYRRHSPHCPHRADGRRWRRCRCPIHVAGSLEGVKIRRSLQTRNWQRATEIVRAWEADGVAADPSDVSVEQARAAHLADISRRRLSASTERKYCLLWTRLCAFAQRENITHLRQFDVPSVREFVATWKDGPLTQVKNLERLRAIFRFACDAGWIDSNPAKPLKLPRVNRRPTMPFTREEMDRILAACELYPDQHVHRGLPNAKRVRALILLLRYSGLRIGDAAACEVKRLSGDRLFLYAEKTGVPVYCRLPPFVVKALEEMPRDNDRYFFWSGVGTKESNSEVWRRRIKKVFQLAGVRDGHPHRFRDTFAVELLLAGVPIDRVSVLLGHSSVTITERHYAPWVRARQEQLEADLARAWERDPIYQRGMLEAATTQDRHIVSVRQ